MGVGPSAHLSFDEVACRDANRTPYPVEWYDTRLVELADLFEAFREWCGGEPLVVLSAYRTPKWNRHVGGATRSQHVQGRALDLTRRHWSIARLHKEARAFTRSLPHLVGGLGLYPTFIHLDTRETDRLIVWNGARPKAEVRHA